MNKIRNTFTPHDYLIEEDTPAETPPLFRDHDERRMQVRVYNFWASLLKGNSYPHINALTSEALPDFSANSILLSLEEGIENPAIVFLGANLTLEYPDIKPTHLDAVHNRSLLSRITDHYMQILANKAPIGFEAEFENQHNIRLLYRGILLPFSSNTHTIDHIFGVINWTECASAATSQSIRHALCSQSPEIPPTAQQLSSPIYSMETYADAPIDAEIEFYSESLMDLLARARNQAFLAISSDGSNPSPLYNALSQAYDLTLCAEDEPEALALLLHDAGLKQDTCSQDSSYSAIIKLIFGPSYNAEHIQIYAALLQLAANRQFDLGDLGVLLHATEGGISAFLPEIQTLRQHVASSSPAQNTISNLHDQLHTKPFTLLPTHQPQPIQSSENEFALLIIRRMPDGTLAILGEISDHDPLFIQAANTLT